MTSGRSSRPPGRTPGVPSIAGDFHVHFHVCMYPTPDSHPRLPSDRPRPVSSGRRDRDERSSIPERGARGTPAPACEAPDWPIAPASYGQLCVGRPVPGAIPPLRYRWSVKGLEKFIRIPEQYMCPHVAMTNRTAIRFRCPLPGSPGSAVPKDGNGYIITRST
jgi:hypothetical protein